MLKVMFDIFKTSVNESLKEIQTEVSDLKKTVELVSNKFDSLREKIVEMKDIIEIVKSEINILRSENVYMYVCVYI